MADFGTWNAWTQYWLAQILFGDLWLQRACFRYFEDGNTAHFDAFLDENRPGDHAPFAQDKRALLEDLGALLAVKGNGVVDTGEAMLQRLAEESWLPRHVFDWGAPEARNVDLLQRGGRRRFARVGALKAHPNTCATACLISSCQSRPEFATCPATSGAS